MSRSRKIIYSLLGFAVFALAISTPGIVEGRKQKRAVDSTFDLYSRALVSGDYTNAYQLCGDAFKREIPFEAFVGKHRELESSFGRLKAIENEGTFVHGKGSPMEWAAVIGMHQLYERGDLHVVCELHLENENWRLFGCKQV